MTRHVTTPRATPTPRTTPSRRTGFLGLASMTTAVVVLSASFLAGPGPASAAPRTATTTTAERVVAAGPNGEATSRIAGTTARGDRVRGSFTPLQVIRKNGKVKVRGLLEGRVVRNGVDPTFAAVRTLRVRSINGTSLTGDSARTAAAAAPACDVLNLDLRPISLDLLGLQVDLSRVVLNVVAQSGAGNLLGNLLCAVVGLLDGGLAGALGRLTNLLNQILGALRLGV